ncbi:MAG: hypothetical protein MKZ54_04750 [Candidatus Poseidoniaceae archaeon]|nr:hypothetical protein [Candidatus Poseidoniaceae archaeon]
MRKSVVALLLAAITLIPLASASSVAKPTDFDVMYLYPLFLALLIAALLWKFFVPRQLSALQVAFEIDDNLYEVHRLTRTVDDARDILQQGRVAFGVGLYMMGMLGVLLLISELLFQPDVYFEPNLWIIGLFVLLPILISPWETMNAQLAGKGDTRIGATTIGTGIRRIMTLSILVSATIITLIYGINQTTRRSTPVWLAITMLVFMAPTILAYGRIMGASWNMLLLNKWRTANGRRNPIDPDKPSFVNRLFSLLLVLFLITMPVTALNGIVTVFHVLYNSPDNAEEILNYGGIIGHSIYERIDLISEILFHWEFIKSMPQFLSLYLSLNIAIVGLAFIFELTRNLILGGQTFGGMFGVTLDTPREIRTEESAQGRQIAFAFAGFSGYTVLLLILVCYKEFGDLMPFTSNLESQGFNEEMRLLSTWMFIAVGNSVFLFTWLLSIARLSPLRQIRFDLDPEDRREGAVMLAGGDWMREYIDNAALQEDLDGLIRFQKQSIEGDQSLVRHEKARAKMWESAIRGLWPKSIEEAKKVLAQSGGDDDEARMLIATGHIATRRLDAARGALRGLQQPEGYDEPELLAFICEWLDPWNGSVDEDDLWDWENNSTIDHLNEKMRMLRYWAPSYSKEAPQHTDKISLVSSISNIATLRMQRRHEEALELALEAVKQDPLGVRPRIAAALCLLDRGDWHQALSIYRELRESDVNDPRVKALSVILGHEADTEDIEVSLVLEKGKSLRRWLDDAPVNPVAGLATKGGIDEAINANVMIVSHEAVRRGMTPRYSPSLFARIIQFFLLPMIYVVIGIGLDSIYGPTEGAVAALTLFVLQFGLHRFNRQQRKQIHHRDQRSLVEYAKMMKRFKVKPNRENIPVGTHLLLSGLLVTVNGVVLDIGLPGWMTERLPKDSDKTIRSRLNRTALSISKNRPGKLSVLSSGWWLKRPKEEDGDMPALERLIGPVAYRGRQTMVQKKTTTLNKSTSIGPSKTPVSELNLSKRNVPTHTFASERSTYSGPRRPGQRRK